MAKTDHEHLLRALGEHFVPFLTAQKFVQHPLSTKEAASGEMLAAFPFGRLRRASGGRLDLLEIQLDKHGTPRFVINFGRVPLEGVTLPWGHLTPDEVGASALPEAYRLYSRSYWPSWFSLGWLPRSKEARVLRAVTQAVSLYPEIETWLTQGVVGSHMRRFGFPKQGR